MFIMKPILHPQVGELTGKYLKRATGTSESYKDISTVPFPVLTICPTYPYKDDRLRYHGIDIVRDLQVMSLNWSNPSSYINIDKLLFQFNSQWISNDSNVTPKEFYNDVVYGLEDVVLNVLFNLVRPINGNKNPRVTLTTVLII